MRLLLAEDEKELAHALETVLKRNHYTVDVVYDGADAYDWAMNTKYDGILLDIMMPKLSGLEVLQALRKNSCDVPVLLLTAKGEVEDKVLGLDLGADDYLAKPFAMKELLARLRAMTRRQAVFSSNVLEFHGLTLNRENYALGYQKQELRLGNKEFQMLELLMRNPEQMISAEHFMERIWGYEAEAEINVVWVYLSYLRKKLGSLNAPVEIKAFRGVGYRLEQKV